MYSFVSAALAARQWKETDKRLLAAGIMTLPRVMLGQRPLALRQVDWCPTLPTASTTSGLTLIAPTEVRSIGAVRRQHPWLLDDPPVPISIQSRHCHSIWGGSKGALSGPQAALLIAC